MCILAPIFEVYGYSSEDGPGLALRWLLLGIASETLAGCYDRSMFERTDPKTMMKWLILAAVVYLLLPFDLIPDFLGIPGRIDDIGAIAVLAWFYWNHVQRYSATGSGHEAAGGSADTRSRQGYSAQSKHAEAFDAYQVLGVTRSASSDEIQAAYRARMKEYHPDKVAHLGEALQTLAHQKSQEIQRAYQQLRR